jgi:hypothetical protein
VAGDCGTVIDSGNITPGLEFGHRCWSMPQNKPTINKKELKVLLKTAKEPAAPENR